MPAQVGIRASSTVNTRSRLQSAWLSKTGWATTRSVLGAGLWRGMDPRQARSSSKFEMASSARRQCMHDDRGRQVQGDAERDAFAISVVVGRDQHVGRDFRIHLLHPYAPPRARTHRATKVWPFRGGCAGLWTTRAQLSLSRRSIGSFGRSAFRRAMAISTSRKAASVRSTSCCARALSSASLAFRPHLSLETQSP